MIWKLEISYENHHLPGKKIVDSGLTLLRSVVQIQSPVEFFNKIDRDRDDFLDFAEDYEPVKAFFNGNQKISLSRLRKDCHLRSVTFYCQQGNRRPGSGD